MKKTAMQQLLKEVIEAREMSVDVNFRSALDFVRDTIEWDYIKEEKEQMIDAFVEGMRCQNFDPNRGRAEQYFNETFKTNEK
jgi:hypothetical protein